MRLVTAFKLLILLWGLSACSPKVYAPVEARAIETERQEIQRLGGHLIRFVKPGDTLYGIAFESNLSIRTLAAWNGINDYRSLRVGQRLRLTKPFGFIDNQARSKPVNSSVVKTKPNKPTPQAVEIKRPTTKTSAKILVESSEASGSQAQQASSAKTSASKWVWPVNGNILRTFSLKNGRQGIDISVVQGTPVLASRAGEVVYVGSSLKGYGKLIIIKHDGDFLSAYAHNKKILVKEGQTVKIKQRIGTSGLNNRNESAVQFQIRIDGNSVNPLPYLKVYK